jgi:hypothetical protein
MELAVVDADDSGELSTALKTFGGTVNERYTKHPLENGDKIYPPFDKTARTDPKFHELFPGSDQLERDIFEVCFEEESANIPVKDGMFGRPSVGATIFAQNKDTQLNPVFQRARQAGTIFIAGSLVGGTGAGIIHQLVRALHSRDKRIYGLIFLRWFQVRPGVVQQTIDDDSLDRNMRYGLDYFFRDTRPLLKASLLIGAPDHPPDRVGPIDLEAGRTEEKRHYFHLMAAYGILKLPQIAVTEQTDGSVYASAFDYIEQMYEKEWQGRPLSWYVNRAAFVKEILDYVGSEERFGKEILKTFGLFGLFGNPENVGRGLHETIARYDKSQRKTVVEEITRTWSLLSKQYEFSLTWLAEVLKPLPDSFYLDKYRRVKENDDARVKEIQTVWAEAPLLGEHLFTSPETSPEVARKFHEKLVESFA